VKFLSAKEIGENHCQRYNVNNDFNCNMSNLSQRCSI